MKKEGIKNSPEELSSDEEFKADLARVIESSEVRQAEKLVAELKGSIEGAGEFDIETTKELINDMFDDETWRNAAFQELYGSQGWDDHRFQVASATLKSVFGEALDRFKEDTSKRTYALDERTLHKSQDPSIPGAPTLSERKRFEGDLNVIILNSLGSSALELLNPLMKLASEEIRRRMSRT